MKVRAKFSAGKYGFLGGQRRYDGDIFDIEPNQFSESWMVKLDDDKPKRGRKPASEQLDDENGAE